MKKEVFGVCKDGRTASLYTIANKNGMTARISDFGGVIVSLLVPDKDGVMTDLVLGFDTLAEYEVNPPYLGAAIGRCGNRIVHGTFTLDDVTYQLECNAGANHLHGGPEGFDKKLWNAVQTAGNSLTLTLLSPDGDQGYPGNLVACVTYTITDDNALVMRYRGMSDKKTIFNMTNHSYFNLAGQESDSILDQELMINAEKMATVDENVSATGDMIDVNGTPFDFRKPKKIGADIRADHTQIKYVGGFDHHFDLNKNDAPAAQSYCTQTGIGMTMYTDCPGVQLYTGNYLDDGMSLKGGKKANKHCAFCLETQFAPDAVNRPQFDSPVIEAGECSEYETRYVFSVGAPWNK
jgi:aldose 1-epimerase